MMQTLLAAFAQAAPAVPAASVGVGARLMGFVGIAVLILVAYAMSENRRAISWRLVGMALVLQAVFALLVLVSPAGLWFFSKVGESWTRFASSPKTARGYLRQPRPLDVPSGGRPMGLRLAAGMVANTGASSPSRSATISFLASLRAVCTTCT